MRLISSRQLILFNKPYQVLSQFTSKEGKATLADYIDMPEVYPAGRLDYDSEGLLLLTNNGRLHQRIAHPKAKLPKTYVVQVERKITPDAIVQLQRGVAIQSGRTSTQPAQARYLEQPPDWLWERHPPIRFRANIPTSWIQLAITEGKNRQVRRMTAAVGFATLRLVRTQIGPWTLQGLRPGEWMIVSVGREFW